MNEKLRAFLVQRIRCYGDLRGEPEEVLSSAAAFHRRYPTVETSEGSEAAREECLGVCTEPYCKRIGQCMGGIVYVNELSVIKQSLSSAQATQNVEKASGANDLLDIWRKI